MSVNWKMDETALGRETFAEDFDDYGRGEDHKVSIGDEVEATDKYGRTHARGGGGDHPRHQPRAGML